MSTELEDRQFEVISAGAEDVDRTLGGGIPYRTLMLIEGQSASGKSTLAQQLVWGALGSGEKAAVYTTEQTVHSFLRQTTSLGLDVRDYFLMDLLHIYPISIAPDAAAPEVLFEELRRHIMNQKDSRVILVDALSTFVSSTGGDQIQGFFNGCKSLCDEGKVVICTVHTDAFDPSILTRVRSICDAHLRLEVGKVGGRLQKTIEVAKIRGADSSTGNISGFEIDPGLGIRIVPISIARA
ncbi:MAG: AAA family ATPase [Chloroflexi bacterium]|nr:AAA family ATPase [Chloroflexota bacterium]